MALPFTKAERDELLRKRRESLKLYNEALDRSASHDPWSYGEINAQSEAERRLQAASLAESEYFERLPHATMSCCPFDGQPLIRTFDPYGLDGLWWRGDAAPEEERPCAHFSLLAGALSYAGAAPRAGDFEVSPGPEIPYVIPRILEMPQMFAVISKLVMENGYVAYPVAYFAEKRPPAGQLAGGWARTNFVYTAQSNRHPWHIPGDSWDFDLRPWLQVGKLRWCAPGEGGNALSYDGHEESPYADLPGRRERIIVRGDRWWTAGLPSGEPVVPVMG